MSSLKLITTEKFGSIPCDFYRNMNDDILLTREQIGSALEYATPSTAIKNIHRKHRDRLDQFSLKVKLGGYQNEPTSKSEEQERVYYTERGVMEICRWSRQPKANQFMDWCWDIVTKPPCPHTWHHHKWNCEGCGVLNLFVPIFILSITAKIVFILGQQPAY